MVSFELRRAHADLILCFKIVHGFLNINMTDFFEFEHNTVRLLGGTSGVYGD